jgi:sporulation protein YlmC with PRC-barrel domain
LIGKNVDNAAGKSIGEIKDLVVNMSTQKVHYAVLSFDPTLASPEQHIAFSVTSFKLQPDKDQLILDVDKDKLAAMPSWTADKWPNLNDPGYLADLQRDLDAYPRAESPASMFMSLDTNDDGYLSMEEAAAQKSVQNAWAKLDQDRDDRISQSEFNASY